MKNNIETQKFIKSLESDLTKNRKTIETENENETCFIIKPINNWIDDAKKSPIPKMIFSEFWYQNELSILFADTNVGKSILALQIGNCVAKGISIPEFKNELEPQKVLLFDFELSPKQVENRYSANYQDHYVFNDNLLRVEINPLEPLPAMYDSFDDFLCTSIESAIVAHGAKIIIIDNLTYLKTETEKSKDAIPLMRFLNEQKKKHGLSILVLAHTPKRNSSRPITVNDLMGSKMLSNFCDSIFAISFSAEGKCIRYIKQIKQRNTELIYGAENVVVCKLEKEHNFLQFNFQSFDDEANHLVKTSKDDIYHEIKDLKAKNMSNVSIAEKLNMSEGNVRKILKANE